MSASSPVWVTGPVLVPRERPDVDHRHRDLALRLTAFGALALYGALRWGTLLTPAPTGRLLGLVAIAVLLAGLGPLLAARSRALAVALALVAFVAMLVVCGLPWHWIRHLRIAVSSRAIGTGLQALPQLLVPYRGANEWVRMVILLGAAVLLLDGALMMAFGMAPRPGSAPARGDGDLRRAVAALPLIALAVVPLTLVPATLAYVQGLWLFALLAALVWGERLRRGARGPAVFACAAAAVAAMVLAPVLDAHKPWFNYETLANGLAPSIQESFDWSQRYGPLTWPRDGREILEVDAKRGDYWKAVNLDGFDGVRWRELPGQQFTSPAVTRASLKRWTQKVTVSLGLMRTYDVIGPGELSPPTHTTQDMTSGASPGRWRSTRLMQAGDSYTVEAYSPHPSAKQLRTAGTNYPQSLVPLFLQLTLPSNGSTLEPILHVDSFGSPAPALVYSNYGSQDALPILERSPYWRVFTLAQRLRDQASTPYDFVLRVMRYLGKGYYYDETPPPSRYPLVSFLLESHQGYCQQFAGAMALLLRLGGVPARVAAGFTQGRYNSVTHRWLVSDYDAHAWVEVYFPAYGWVWFDPTPAVDPALQRNPPGSPLDAGTNVQTALFQKAQGTHGLSVPGQTRGAQHATRHGAGELSPVVLAALALAGLLVLGLAAVVLRTGDLRPEARLAELERAFARSGRGLEPHVTLSELERRVRGVPEAEAYVRALSAARFGAGAPPAAGRERRAVRAHLRSGLGVGGALRALWALPPRIRVRVPDWWRVPGARTRPETPE